MNENDFKKLRRNLFKEEREEKNAKVGNRTLDSFIKPAGLLIVLTLFLVFALAILKVASNLHLTLSRPMFSLTVLAFLKIGCIVAYLIMVKLIRNTTGKLYNNYLNDEIDSFQSCKQWLITFVQYFLKELTVVFIWALASIHFYFKTPAFTETRFMWALLLAALLLFFTIEIFITGASLIISGFIPFGKEDDKSLRSTLADRLVLIDAMAKKKDGD